LLDDAFHDAGQEVAACALAEQRADFLIVEEGDDAEAGGVGDGGGGVEERLDSGPAAELVVDAAGEDEFFVETAGAGGLGVEEFEFPVDEGGVCCVSERSAGW
jgi:hypothetical protein